MLTFAESIFAAQRSVSGLEERHFDLLSPLFGDEGALDDVSYDSYDQSVFLSVADASAVPEAVFQQLIRDGFDRVWVQWANGHRSMTMLRARTALEGGSD